MVTKEWWPLLRWRYLFFNSQNIYIYTYYLCILCNINMFSFFPSFFFFYLIFGLCTHDGAYGRMKLRQTTKCTLCTCTIILCMLHSDMNGPLSLPLCYILCYVSIFDKTVSKTSFQLLQLSDFSSKNVSNKFQFNNKKSSSNSNYNINSNNKGKY